MEVVGVVSVEIVSGSGERAHIGGDQHWRWRERVRLVRFDGLARSVEVEVCGGWARSVVLVGFFFGLQVVGRYRFSRSKGVGSVMEVVNGNLLYLVAKKMVNKMLFVYLLLI